MKTIGIIGFGTIGKKLYEQILEEGLLEVAFVYDTETEVPPDLALAHALSGADFAQVDLVVEAALSQVVETYGREILTHTNFMPFSLTALANQQLYDDLLWIAAAHQHQLFVPHGAILGLDGMFDGRKLFDEVKIVTVKNPKSLGRNDTVRRPIFEGSAREVAKLMPRNVNVHAALALAGIGFDQTQSILISDPTLKENTHTITAKSADITVEVTVKSNPIGAVTSAFTPVSAYGSVKRALGITPENVVVV